MGFLVAQQYKLIGKRRVLKRGVLKMFPGIFECDTPKTPKGNCQVRMKGQSTVI